MESENPKEERIRSVALAYYSRSDIKKALYDFSKQRETVPRFMVGFGRRPDSFQYESDITAFVGRGATSFHCSEEIWRDPLAISTDLNEKQLNDLRDGWDLILDIDCKYLEYSKMAAESLVKALEFHGVKNVGVKFSGSKGFHLIVPWGLFPKEVYGQKTSEMFPKFPRLICQYLTEVARPILEQELEKDDFKFTSRLDKGFICNKCKRIAEELAKSTFFCPICKRIETSESPATKKKKRCPDCRVDLVEKEKQVFYRCKECNLDSITSPDSFRPSIDVFKVLGIDVVLVSNRHLFRMPYSLHEKTSLASVVIEKEKIREFKISDANPLKVTVRNFLVSGKEDEAKELLVQAIDWGKEKERLLEKNSKEVDFKEVVIKDLTPNLYPPCVLEILKGMKQDGRKRALFVLMNFFKSLNLSSPEIKKRVEEWNNANYKPLQEGYVRSQLGWHERQKPVLPPNCDKPHYKELEVCKPDGFCRYIKNPVNYTIRKNFVLSKNREAQENKRSAKRKD